jgi:hypothetical protein
VQTLLQRSGHFNVVRSHLWKRPPRSIGRHAIGALAGNEAGFWVGQAKTASPGVLPLSARCGSSFAAGITSTKPASPVTMPASSRWRFVFSGTNPKC